MTKLGDRRDERVSFMDKHKNKGQKLLFDGTSISTSASDTYAQKGYNPSKRQGTQIRLLYVFDKESGEPVFYRVLPGNIVDNVSLLMEYRLRFILPLQSNTKLISDDFAKDPDRHKFDGVFVYHGRQIWYKKEKTGEKGNHLYIFLDEGRRQKEESNYLEKLDEGYGDLTKEGFFDNSRRGLFAFVSNLDTDCKEIYLDYKSRWRPGRS